VTQATSQGPALDWLVNTFVEATPGVANSVVVSSDGILLAVCDLLSLTEGASRLLEAGPVKQTVVEMAEGYLLLMAVGTAACLATLASTTCDIGLVGYEMTLLAIRARDALSPAARTDAP
jgi:predicted regulator of Ras-like GTPase activity (Roadblock/LC7/MglB family)